MYVRMEGRSARKVPEKDEGEHQAGNSLLCVHHPTTSTLLSCSWRDLLVH